eukprot:3991095-Pyramimonas_sp.AAC.1
MSAPLHCAENPCVALEPRLITPGIVRSEGPWVRAEPLDAAETFARLPLSNPALEGRRAWGTPPPTWPLMMRR